MKPIATLHWSDDGREYSKAYTHRDSLQLTIDRFNREGVVYVLCMTSIHTPLPNAPRKYRFEGRRSS